MTEDAEVLEKLETYSTALVNEMAAKTEVAALSHRQRDAEDRADNAARDVSNAGRELRNAILKIGRD